MQKKLTEELIEALSAEIRDGLPVGYACDLLGVTTQAYNLWMRKGEAASNAEEPDPGDELYARLFSEIKKAYAQFVKDAKNEMRKRLNGWQSIAWWLERTNPFFMPKQQIQADDDGKVTVVIGGRQKDPKPLTKKEAEERKPEVKA